MIVDGGTLVDSGASLLESLSKNGGYGVSIIFDDGAVAAVGGEQDVDIPSLCRELGFARIRELDPFGIKEIGDVLLEEAESAEVSVLIVQAPCPVKSEVKRPAYGVDPDRCEGCQHCFKVECSAMRVITRDDGGERVEIEASDCAGCGICLQLCKHDAIVAPATR